jgi:hypothetical protein
MLGEGVHQRDLGFPCVTSRKEVGTRGGEAVLLAMVWNFRFENISATDLVISVFLLAEVRKFSLKIHLNIQKVVKYF